MQPTNVSIAHAAHRESETCDASSELGGLLAGATVDSHFLKGPAIGTSVGEAAPPSFSSMAIGCNETACFTIGH